MPAALKVHAGSLQRRVLILPDAGELLLGSSLEAHVCLPGEEVADRHAMIRPDPRGHQLVPVSTRYPTLLTGKRLMRPTTLRGGDRIEIGPHLLEYVGAAARTAILPEAASPEARCAACGDQLGPDEGPASLQALKLGTELVCPRCVDQRLRTDRSLETFRILRKVGQNEEEITYLAHDRERDERVGLRILKADRQANPHVVRRFLVRALVGLVLGHPNYLEVRRVGASRGILFTVLELVEGAWKLETFVRQRSPQRPARSVWLCRQLGEVLRFARTRQIVVAKRKRSGVLVARRTLAVRVQAFDLVRELEASVSKTEVFRQTAAQAGLDPEALMTAGFPEPRNEDEARLSRLASEYAETYSIGRILFQLLVGRPFEAGAVAQVHAAAIKRRSGVSGAGPLEKLELPCLNLLERVLVPKGPSRIKTLEDLIEACDLVSAAPELDDVESEDEVGDADVPEDE